MRVLCLIDRLMAGGAQRQLTTIAAGLQRRGHEVEMLTWGHEAFYLPMLEAAGVKYTCTRSESKAKAMVAVRKYIRSSDCDVVLAFQENAGIVAAFSALPFRNWGLVVSERNATPRSLDRKGRLRRQLHHLVDFVTTNSNANSALILEDVPALKPRMVTIYNGLDLDTYSPPQHGRIGERGSLRVVVAARYSYQKNIEGALQAMALTKNRNDLRIELDWYGDTLLGGPSESTSLYPGALKTVRELEMEDRVRLHAASDSILDHYRSADAVMLPSLYEGLPNTVCEAMACGRPILMSKVADAEALVSDGDNGYLFDPGKPEEIAAALIRMAELSPAERDSMGRASRSRAEQMFSIDRLVSDYSGILERAVARRRSRSCSPVAHTGDAGA